MSDLLLSPRDLALVDAVAQRVLELLDGRGCTQERSQFVTAGELAGILGVSRDWVYRHADELGAERIGIGGDGSRSQHGGRRLRFDLEGAIAAATVRQASEDSQSPDPPAPAGRGSHGRRPALGSEVPLLPDRCPNGRRSSKAQNR